MVATLHAFAGVVQEQREVKQVGQVDVLQNMGVVREWALVGIPDMVELLKANERMFIRGVGVKKLVLYQAGHSAEFRDKPAQQIDLVHGAHRGSDVAAVVENLEERLVHLCVFNERFVDQ